MKIYVAHSKDFDFVNELYGPIKNSSYAQEHQFIFPHDRSDVPFNSKEFFETDCSLIIAEVSYPATGLGIELGWADMLHVPIACFYKKGHKLSKSLSVVTKSFFEYDGAEDLLLKLGEALTLSKQK